MLLKHEDTKALRIDREHEATKKLTMATKGFASGLVFVGLGVFIFLIEFGLGIMIPGQARLQTERVSMI